MRLTRTEAKKIIAKLKKVQKRWNVSEENLIDAMMQEDEPWIEARDQYAREHATKSDLRVVLNEPFRLLEDCRRFMEGMDYHEMDESLLRRLNAMVKPSEEDEDEE